MKITASTLYEAAALALAEFRRCGFADAMFGPATKLMVSVRQPEVSHIVSVARLRSWRYGSGKSPNEHAMKSRLKGMVF